MMDEVVVKVHRLSKSYGALKVVNDVSFQLERNKIYGFLGRNGAGKTTIMNMLTGQLFATSGDISLFGGHPYENRDVLSQVCFIKESQKYPDNWKVGHVIDTAASFYPLWDHALAQQLIQAFNLPLDRTMKKLSRGMLSSVGIIIGLASHAPLTIFDEPYLGLDAVARQMFYDRLMEDYTEHPRTIVLSTHLIDEVARLLEHVIVIDQGAIMINESADSLREHAFGVAGMAAKVRDFVQGQTLIHQENLGALMTATISGKLTADRRRQAEGLGLEIVPISLQQLIVQWTQAHSDPTQEGRVQ